MCPVIPPLLQLGRWDTPKKRLPPPALPARLLAKEEIELLDSVGSAPDLLHPFDTCATFPPAASSMPPCP